MLNLIVEIKGYRGEDAKEKKSTMDTYWVPGVNNLGKYGRWAFAEFREVYQHRTRIRREDRRRVQQHDRHRRTHGRKCPIKETNHLKPLKKRGSAHARGSLAQIHPDRRIPVLVQREYQDPLKVAYERRNRDLDPQLVWRGKDEQDWTDLVVNAPPLYIQEKVHPKVLIDDLMRRGESKRAGMDRGDQFDLFADFNGLPDTDAKTEFYQHDAHWTNRMILGDSLQVMASLAEREGLRGKVQCIYFDPPYGIKFKSNFQWSTTSRDVKDGD